MKRATQKRGGVKKDDNDDHGASAGGNSKITALLMNADNMPNVGAADSELGLDSMLRIIPDTWNNISWVV